MYIVRREQKMEVKADKGGEAKVIEKTVPDDVETFYSAAKKEKQEPRIPTAEEIKDITNTDEYIIRVWGNVLK